LLILQRALPWWPRALQGGTGAPAPQDTALTDEARFVIYTRKFGVGFFQYLLSMIPNGLNFFLKYAGVDGSFSR
jgi:hypothetical protein